MQHIDALFRDVPDVRVQLAPIVTPSLELLPPEQAATLRMAPQRAEEFAAGRWLARRVLTEFGLGDVAIPMSAERWPIWPQGIAGSITHSARSVAVAVSTTDCFAGLGLDLEQPRRLADELVSKVLTAREHATRSAGSDPTLWFACKEAIYKAVNPTFGEFLDFSDVELEFDGNRFLATCQADRVSCAAINSGWGRFDVTDCWIQALYVIEQWPSDAQGESAALRK
ncbi:MAG: 4'-phosphopantetheinyl transferase superfamily protein [Pseudomonadota bacterium]